MLTKLAVVVALFAACSQSGSAPSGGSAASAPRAGSDPCATVGDGVKAIWVRQAADATDRQSKQEALATGDKAVARLQRHCRDDHWSPEVIECVRSGGATCTNQMTPEQAQKLTGDKM